MGWPDTLNPSSTWVATKLCMYHDLFVLLQATTWSPYSGPYFLLLRIRGLHSFAKSFLKSHQKFFSKILNCGLSYLCTTVYWKDSCFFLVRETTSYFRFLCKFDFICSLMHELSDFNSLAIYHALDASRFVFFCKTRIVIVKFPEEKKTWSKVLVKFLSNLNGGQFFFTVARDSMGKWQFCGQFRGKL